MNHPSVKINLTAAAVGLLTILLLLLTAWDIGITWDEPVYVAASNSYASWFQNLLSQPQTALTPAAIDQAWGPNHEHPPLVKIYSGLVWSVARNLMDDLTAHRLGTILLVGVLTAVLFKFTTEEAGSWAGFAAVAGLLAMPRFFFHAHLIALDVPAAAMTFFTAYIFWRTKDRSGIRYAFLLAAAGALALSAKITAFYILPVCFLWALMFQRKPHLLLRLAAAGLMAFPLSWLIWPWLYTDTANRLAGYLFFPLNAHWTNREFYFNQIYTNTPWHFPFVMVWITVPLGTTFLYCLGLVRCAIERKTRPLGALFFLAALVPLLVQATGRFIIFDYDRFLMPAFPFLAALAGIGFAWLVRAIRRLLERIRLPRLVGAAAAVAGALCLASPVVQSAQLYPHLLSYFSEQTGGLAGAERMGMEPTYWCDTYGEALVYINRSAAPGDTVWAEGTSFRVLQYYQLLGKLRSDIRFAVPPGSVSVFGSGIPFPADTLDYSQASFAVVQNHKILFFDDFTQPTDILRWMNARQPNFTVSREGVTLLSIYRNP